MQVAILREIERLLDVRDLIGRFVEAMQRVHRARRERIELTPLGGALKAHPAPGV